MQKYRPFSNEIQDTQTERTRRVLKGVITFEPKYRILKVCTDWTGTATSGCCGLLVRITEKAGRLP